MSKIIQKQELNEQHQLFSEFPATSYLEWRQAAEKSLKGASFEEKLVSQTYEGIELQPMYFQEDIRNLSYRSSKPGSAPYVHVLPYQVKG
ncbi:hypothetical protein PH210_04385 [Paenibacillus sp. BSR1-1]|uniref:hypothetical protein n=1 Tax=Paenibacillus sp. BSR1-1 TaxID=3020845 RepID=UPI0025AF4B79|nr:hypothetical protein [Paenibacillus sp. BSR1-1]MDN3015447.1 hypothetical protein [Paenibacillus sp. BSR1-1]